VQKSVDHAAAIRTKYPEQVVIAIAKDVKGKPNPITLGWTMITSGSPPMMAISIGETRYSLEALRHSGEFVVAFPSEDAAEEAMFYGTKSGRDIDKLKEFGAKTQPASKIDGVLLADAVANFECVVRHEIHTGDHFLFVGEVVAAHVNTETKGRLYTLASGYRMGGVSVKD
jgi:flavin reductase (DIM6/NTAB) family NADH-FMN oxidoreductase RutF